MMTHLAADSATTTSKVGSARKAASGAERAFLGLLDTYVEDSAIRFIIRGAEVVVGKAAPRETPLTTPTLRINDERFFRRVLSGGNLGLGESYMDRDWDMEEGDLEDLLTILLRNRLDRRVRVNAATALMVLRIQFANLFRAPHWRHAQFQYDLGDELFESFLDPVTMMYSCGYAETPDDTIEQLQINKLNRICEKMEVKPGDRVLDIGCGFAGLLIHAARHFGATGVGITTSRRHQAHGAERVTEAGLSDRIRIELRDHRTIDGEFDHVVSVGMFEHLPRAEYGRFFERVAAVLPRHGTGLLHTVGANAPRNTHDPFIQKYALPGTSQPKLSELAAGCEQSGLAIRDVENIVRHYGYTARHWLRRFRENKHLLDQ
jgi:cyclopropane-fatty-acyl-phospholipid synthase